MKNRKEATKKPVTTWNADDIGFENSIPNRVRIEKFYPIEMIQGQGKIIEGKDAEDSAKKLAQVLVRESII